MAVVSNSDDKEVHPSSLLAAQGMAFARVLAGNEKKRRDHGLKKLQKWFTARSNGPNIFTEDDFMKIWVGLYYSMWMSDKPLIQEELAESLGRLIFCFGENEEAALLFIKCFYKTMCQSWIGLDQHRLDKFAMLVRRFLRQSLVFCEKRGWEFSVVKKLMAVFSNVVLHPDTTLGFKLHFLEIFLEELAKVGREDLMPKVTAVILKPFIDLMATTREGRIRFQLDLFFRHLIRQTDAAQEYQEKFNAWQRAGFPSGHINQIVAVEDENVESGETTEISEEIVEREEGDVLLDPRAGSVHVSLPQIKVPSGKILKYLKRRIKEPDTTLKGRKTMQGYMRYFRKLKQGKYPFGVTEIEETEGVITKRMIAKSAKKLVKQSTRRKKNKKLVKAKLKKLNAELSDNKENSSDNKENNNDVDDDSLKSGQKRKRADDGGEKESVTKKKKSSDVPSGQSPRKSKPQKRSPEEKSGLITSTSTIEEAKITTTPTKKRRKSSSEAIEVLNDVQHSSPTNKRSPPAATSTPPSPKAKSPGKKSPPKPQAINWLIEDVDADTPIKPPKNIVCEKRIPDDEKDPWTEPLRDGEYEFFVERKKKVTPVFWDKAKAKASPKGKPSTPTAKSLIEQIMKPSSGRRISFNLDKNRAQETQEYWEGIRLSPQIPFDADKMPSQSALKPGLAPSPINPFYRRRKTP